MAEEQQCKSRGARSGPYLFMLHGLCFILVVVYVNMFQFWAWLCKELGPGMLVKILPILVTLAVLLIISLRFVQRVNKGYRIKFLFLTLGIVGAFFALAIPDPNIPIKRIHVAEYILLAFLVRYALSHRLQGAPLLLFTILVTALYGVHDEMLQGLHTLRYYGWRDIIVNAVGGLSGSLLAHGLLCFDENGSLGHQKERLNVTVGQVVLFVCLFSAVIWQVIYLYYHRGDAGSPLALVPVSVSCVVIAAMNRELVLKTNKHHGLQVIFWLSLGLVVYPVLAESGWLEFL